MLHITNRDWLLFYYSAKKTAVCIRSYITILERYPASEREGEKESGKIAADERSTI